MPRKSDKRERLINSAKSLMFKQGFNLTTLADIAQEADVPLGNVYYYFKTKESIGEAVILHCQAELTQKLLDLDAVGSVKERLNAYLISEINEKDWVVKYGDRYGSLCQELAKQSGPLAESCANLLSLSINWLKKQFVEAGLSPDAAAQKAKLFTVKLQGMNLLAATFANSNHIEELSKWLQADIGSPAHESVTATHEEEAEAFA